MTATELLNTIVATGGTLKLKADGHITCQIPKSLTSLTGELKQHKPELVELLRRKGRRTANFPRCPVCGSYALFREHNVGAYECQTCCQQDIAEDDARRTDASTRRRGNEVIR